MISDLSKLIEEASQDAADAAERRRIARDEQKRVAAVEYLYEHLQDRSGEDWQRSYAARLAEFGNAISMHGFAQNVAGMEPVSTTIRDRRDEKIAIGILRLAVAGNADELLVRIRQIPTGCRWRKAFSGSDNFLARILCRESGTTDAATANSRGGRLATHVEAVIISHGNYFYSVPGGQQRLVTIAEDHVLQAFLTQPAMDTGTLSDAVRDGVGRPREVLGKLKKKYNGDFSAAITLPGKKGNGGYAVNIRRAQ
ncbi:MAG TPA: hypothetical protein VHX68_16255 [Planctomycetaceae bacterium]|jgi:hypothetical protein|nr:hypothetical protein [Planctomycetaceae bacterium]